MRKMSFGPAKPLAALLAHATAASAVMAAEAPLLSESCFPARMARKGT